MRSSIWLEVWAVNFGYEGPYTSPTFAINKFQDSEEQKVKVLDNLLWLRSVPSKSDPRS